MEQTQKIAVVNCEDAWKLISWQFAGAKPTFKHWRWYEGLDEMQRQYYLEQQRRACAQRNVEIITMNDARYPNCWRELEAIPKVIYARGDIKLLQTQCLSVVGSRKPNPYSQVMANQICHQAVSSGLTLVSGMAQGIDSTVHEIALNQGGKTIAVLGFGHDECYPKTQWHKQLKGLLSTHQLVISQYPPLTPIAKWRFIERNFLIATLAPACIVIQAGLKSGSLITAEMALERGSDVYIANGIFDDVDYIGGQQLVDEGAISFQHFQQLSQTYNKF